MVAALPNVIVTGAAGFIGSALCRTLRSNNLARVTGIDKMTYSSSRSALSALDQDPDFKLIEVDICNGPRIAEIVNGLQPDAIFHLAAETHVDRSIDLPEPFIQANIIGTFSLLEVTRRYLASTSENRRAAFRFVHISTDEVYGSLGDSGKFTEQSQYQPNSPYAASKAASDHLVRSWHKTYGIPIVIGNCSNNYGPFQFPEKLIPLMIAKALRGEQMPVYGKGLNVRDWLFVEDHAEALWLMYKKGRPGEKYHVGGSAERRNIDLVRQLCRVLDDLIPQAPHWPHHHLIHFVDDRPGHDERYAIDWSKSEKELGWRPRTSFDEGIKKTVAWYLANRQWTEDVRARNYNGERLGLATGKAR